MQRLPGRLTAQIYLIVNCFSVPFWGLITLLPIFLYKELKATPFEVATIIALKPIMALLSPYWSQAVHGRGYRLISNLTWANVLKYVPFLFAPFIQSTWFFIIAFAFFMMLSRGKTPAWMELLNRNLDEKDRKKACITASIIDYLGVAFLALPFGFFLDYFPQAWSYLLTGCALIGILSTPFIRKIPNDNQKTPLVKKAFWLHSVAPWKNCKELLSKRPDFSGFQLGFLLGGAGLMIVQPIIPKFFVDNLHLSYTGMFTAISVCKGIGLTLSSPIWIRIFNQSKIFTMCALVTSFAALFPLFLLGAQSVGICVYLAYLMYGVMQGGSELSWKMSGPIFSRGQDSTPYSSVNLLMVGLRGLILPYVGSAIFFLSNSVTIPLILGGIFSLSATFLMAFFARKYEPAKDLPKI